MADESAIAPTACPTAFERPTFEQLYTSARGWLPAELRRLGVRVDVDDVLHDVILIAHRRLEHFEPHQPNDPTGTLRAWILTIAWHHVTKRWKKMQRFRARFGSASVGAPLEPEPSAEDNVAAVERRQILAAVLAKIKPERAAVLTLHLIHDMTASEIARHLGLNENTVKSRLARGRDDARRTIERLPSEMRGALQDLDEPQGGAERAACGGSSSSGGRRVDPLEQAIEEST